VRRLPWALIGCAVLATCGTTAPEAINPVARAPTTSLPAATVSTGAPVDEAATGPDDDQPTTDLTPDSGVCTPSDRPLVDASDVVVIGTLDAGQRALVDWALERFRPGRIAAAGHHPDRLRPDPDLV
jgi:hypothetical protein